MATTYPFDPTGTSPDNRVVNEQHVVTAVDFRNSNYVIPNFGPFFETNLTISFRDVNNTPRTLVKNVDYYLSHSFISASRACATPIYGSITFLDTSTAGILQISYNTLGGVWTLSELEIANILANNLYNPRTTAWEQVTSLPITFPVIDHEWNLVDLVGATEIVTSLNAIHDAILTQAGAGLPAHLADYNNPHATTAAQVGLGNVQNFPLATTQQAIAGAVNNAYMTPALVKVVLDSSITASFSAHLSRTDNPHNTTATQIGLGNVQNYATASNADALTGTSTTLYMTPAASKAADTVVLTALNTHANRTDNPHATTAAQVGLGNVVNYATASTTDGATGTAANLYMTPVATASAITAQALTPLNTHVNNTSNPHGVTKSQVALGSVQNYAVATQQEAEAAASNSTYMTPVRTYQLAVANASAIVAVHANLTNNPHNTTAAQVGLGNVQNFATASNTDATTGTATNLFMTPATTSAAINATKYTEPVGDVVFTFTSVLASGTRRILVQGQAINLTTYPTLLSLWCGATYNALNATDSLQADFFYRCTDPANPSTSRSNTGNYLVLPPGGYFLRALNTGTTGVDVNRGQYKLQADDFLSHSHTVPSQGGTNGGANLAQTDRTGNTYNAPTNAAGGTETRPKNWGVYVWVCY